MEKGGVVDFLRSEWFDEVSAILAANEDLQAATASATFGVQQVVTDAPGGEIKHYFKAGDGAFEIGLGELPAPDATMTATYADAAAMNRGDLDAMTAFASGKMLVTGNMAILMQHQAVLTQMNTAFEALRDKTTYEA